MPAQPTIIAMAVWIGVAIGVAVLVVAVGLLAVRLRSIQATVDDSWQQVLLALRRRRGLAVEMAEAVRVGSSGEVDLVDRIRDASEVADLPGASPAQQVTAERDLDTVMAELSDVVAGSRGLLDDPGIADLQARLDDADRRIDARRAVYERSAEAYGRRTASFPGRWTARALGIHVISAQDDE